MLRLGIKTSTKNEQKRQEREEAKMKEKYGPK
jgi:hypothetical protein